MAIVKVLFRRSAEGVIRYVFNHTQPGDPADSEYCPSEAQGAVEDFKMARDLHQFQDGRHEVVHLVQSWNEEESKKLTPVQINEMGKKMATEYFKGHQMVVVTHTETGKYHNHIVVNRVNLETGKLIENKFKHLHELRKINDRLCLKKGLSVPIRDPNIRRTRVPQKVQQMMQAGRPSYLLDIKNKADLARFLATSHNQYVNYLDALGIQARVEEKNITYFYPGRSRGKRGDKLGPNYDKEGLEAQYKLNDERFRANPGVGGLLLHGHAQLKTNPNQDTSRLLAYAGIPKAEIPKDYSQYTKQSRSKTPSQTVSERALSHLPVDEIRKARRSIADYCLANDIGLGTNSKGQTVLKGKDYVVIDGAVATNTQNGTKANLIDFVAAHHRLTLLQAVAKINGNPDFLEIEKHFGAVERKFTSFYIPKSDQMSMLQAAEHLGRFLKVHGASPRQSKELLQHQRAEVSSKGVIRFFAESDSGGALEFTEGPDGKWNSRKQGTFQKPFYQRPAKGNKAIIFTDPKLFLAASSEYPFSERSHHGILALMEPNTELVGHYLKQNPGVQRLQITTPKNRALTPGEIDFFGIIQNHYKAQGIELSRISHDRSLSPSSPGLSL